MSHLACSYQAGCVPQWWRWTTSNHIVPAKPVHLPTFPERNAHRKASIVSHLIRDLGVSGPGLGISVLYLMSLCFLILHTSLFNLSRALEHPSAGSAPLLPSSRPAPLSLQGYKSVENVYSVLSHRLNQSITEVFFFSLRVSPRLTRSAIAHHLIGIVRIRRILQ